MTILNKGPDSSLCALISGRINAEYLQLWIHAETVSTFKNKGWFCKPYMRLSGSAVYKFATIMHTKCSCVYMCRGSTICYYCTLTKSKPTFCKTTDNCCSNSLSRQEKHKVESKYIIYLQLLYMEWSSATNFYVWGNFYLKLLKQIFIFVWNRRDKERRINLTVFLAGEGGVYLCDSSYVLEIKASMCR